MNRGRDSHRRGHFAEFLCRLALRLKGYRIIGTRYKTHQGEIDIAAVRGQTLALIEVKARPSVAAAMDAVSFHQQDRLRRTAKLFHAHHRGLSGLTTRFDVMLVLPWHWPLHLENAFPAEDQV